MKTAINIKNAVIKWWQRFFSKNNSYIVQSCNDCPMCEIEIKTEDDQEETQSFCNHPHWQEDYYGGQRKIHGFKKEISFMDFMEEMAEKCDSPEILLCSPTWCPLRQKQLILKFKK